MTCCRKRRGDERTNEPTNQRAQEQTGVNKSTFVYVDITYFAHWGFSPWPSAIRAAFLVLPSAIRAVFLVPPSQGPLWPVVPSFYCENKSQAAGRSAAYVNVSHAGPQWGFSVWGPGVGRHAKNFSIHSVFRGREERTSTVFWPGSRGLDSSPAIGVNWGVPGSGV